MMARLRPFVLAAALLSALGPGAGARAATVPDTHPIFAFSWADGTAAPPATNAITAGGFVAVRFSLGGDAGLGIISDTWPRSQRYDCTTGALLAGSQSPARPDGAAGLSYSSATGLYTYVWQTREEWSGSCRRFQLRLVDMTLHSARFRIAPFHFIPPTLRFPATNPAVAGDTVKVRFNMGAGGGLDVIAEGYPRSRRFDCATGELMGRWAATDPRPPGGLVRNAITHDYRYAWQTKAMWAGTCRRFEMRLLDGSVQVLRYRFDGSP